MIEQVSNPRKSISETMLDSRPDVSSPNPLSRVSCTDTHDTFFTLYNGSFNPASALTNCLAVNDDISGASNRCSTLSFAVPVGETRIVVVAGFNNAATANGLFAYQINFTGTTPVELVEIRVD